MRLKAQTWRNFCRTVSKEVCTDSKHTPTRPLSNYYKTPNSALSAGVNRAAHARIVGSVEFHGDVTGNDLRGHRLE